MHGAERVGDPTNKRTAAIIAVIQIDLIGFALILFLIIILVLTKIKFGLAYFPVPVSLGILRSLRYPVFNRPITALFVTQ